MWLILLDASGSMGDVFEGTSSFRGRTHLTEAAVKLQAAKEALLEHLEGLGSATQIAIFEFRESATLCYTGPSDDLGSVRAVLDGIEPGGGTDAAAALRAARDHIDAHTQEVVFRVLIIADGLSDAAAAELAGRDLLARRVPIDFVLIDVTPKGEDLARKVSGSVGTVRGGMPLAMPGPQCAPRL